MSRIAQVLSFDRVSDASGEGADVKVDAGDVDPVTVPHFGAPGQDAAPLPGDYVALTDSSGSGAEQAVGYADVQNGGVALPGEHRIYARSEDGTTVCQVYARRDGSVLIGNDAGEFVMSPNGDVTINGVVITASGSIRAPGEVTAMAGASAVNLSTHIHPTGIGPTSPPTPGT